MVTLTFFMGILPGSAVQSHGASLYGSTGETDRLSHSPCPHPRPRIYLFKSLVMSVGDVVLHCKLGGGHEDWTLRLVISSHVRLLTTSCVSVQISICICLQQFLFIGRLFVLSEEILIQILCLFFCWALCLHCWGWRASGRIRQYKVLTVVLLMCKSSSDTLTLDLH